MFKRVALFRFFGFKIKADASWFFLAVLISWTMSTYIYPHMYPGQIADVYQWMGVATVAGIIFSILAHEVAHAVIAEYYNMPIKSITLFIFGGVAEMEGEPSNPRGEFMMAIAGPIMSLLVALFFFAVSKLYILFMGVSAVAVVFDYLGQLNLLIAAFNSVPAFPLDGGRALRAAIWHMKNNLVLATRIASEFGAIFAYGLIAYACYKIVKNNDLLAGMWIGILGFFVYSSGSYAVRQMESRTLLGEEPVSRFMTNHLATVTPDVTINALVDEYISKHYQRSFPVIDHGALVGMVRLQTVLSMDRQKWQWLSVSSVMEKVNAKNTVSPHLSAADAMEIMQKETRDHLLVAENDKYIGIIALRDLANYLSITLKIDHNKPVEKSRKAY